MTFLSRSLCLGMLLLTVPVTVCAAQDAPPSVAGDVIAEETTSWRDFQVEPGVSLTGLYDSNIFADHTDEVSDRILIIAPELSITSRWPKHKLNVGARGRFGRYDSNTSEDYDDYDLGLSGRYDLTEDGNLFGGVAYRAGHEERGLEVEQPTEFTQQEAHLGMAYSPGKLRLRFGGTYEYLDFDDSTIAGGINLNNDDRDRQLYGAGIRIGYEYTPSLEPFVHLIYERREYDERFDDFGFERDSDGYRAAVGVKAEPWSGFDAEAYLGYLWQDYNDHRFDAVHKPLFSAEATWLASPQTIISGQIDRSLNETTIPYSSGYLRTEYDISLSHRILADLEFNAYFGLTQDQYNKVNRDDDYYSAGFGLRHDLTDNLYLSAGYRYIERDSSEDSDDYERHQLMVTLGASLSPSKRDPLSGYTPLLETLTPAGQGVVAPGGFYLGAQVGHGGLTTETTELRHSGDSDSSFGGTGFNGGLFAGYGHAIGRWLPAIEVGVEGSDLDWAHSKDKPNSRTMEISREESLAGNLRLGYTLDNGSLLYGLAGLVFTDFEDDYRINNLPESALSDEETLRGLRLGIGLEAPLSERLFVRMESTYTEYETDHLASADFDEDFDNTEAMFNVGLGWRLTPYALPVNTIPQSSLAGFYAGARLGYGTVNSELDARHTDGGSNPGTYNYDADFSNDDFTAGFFAGYGMVYGRLYLGVELDIEASPSKWARERSGSSGRTFSADKEITYGASGRVGLILPNGNLVYARAGVVETTFSARYIKGSNPANHIDRDDDLSGVRIGCGLEVPITAKAFLRLEYSYTEYDDYGITTAHTLSDQLDIDHNETLASIAIGIRF